MSLLFNMLYRFVIAFLPRSKHLLISWLQSPSAVILEPKKIKSFTFSPSICQEVMHIWGFWGGSVVKNLPAVQEMQEWSLGQEDPLEEGMATHSSILAWRIPWTQEPGGLQSTGPQRVGHDWSDWAHTHTRYTCVYSLFHYRVLQDSECRFLCWTVGTCCLSVLHIKACIC